VGGVKLGHRIGALFGREPSPDEAEADEPCIPCGQQKGVRQFSLNPTPPIVIGDDLRLQLTPGRLFAVVDGQVVLYDPARSLSHVLNPSAAAVWASVDGQRTVADIIDAVEQDTGADRAVLDSDIRATLAQFVGAYVVTELVAESAPAPSTPDLMSGPQRESADRWAATISRLLDRIEWTDVIGPRRAGGVELVVRTNQPEAAHELTHALAALAPGQAADRGPVSSVYDPGRGRPLRWYVDGRRQWTGTDPAVLLDDLRSDLTQRVLAATPDHLLLHAGAVERSGRVVLVGGDSGRGKSTLAAALVQHGFAYATDEVAIIDPSTFEVLPYPKALDLDTDALGLLGIAGHRDAASGGRHDQKARRAVPVSALGAPSTGGTVALIVLLDDEIVDGKHADASPAVQDVLDLVGVTFRQSFDDDLALDWLAGLAASVPLVRVTRAPLDQMVAQVDAALAG
jgi:hypothetical protein